MYYVLQNLLTCTMVVLSVIADGCLYVFAIRQLYLSIMLQIRSMIRLQAWAERLSNLYEYC